MITYFNERFTSVESVYWSFSTNTFVIDGILSANNIYGNGLNINNLNPNNLITNIPVSKGGTGNDTYLDNGILYYDGTKHATTSQMIWDNSNSTVTISGSIIANSFTGNGYNLTALNPNNLIIPVPLYNGGTNNYIYRDYSLLFFLPTDEGGQFETSSRLYWSNFNLYVDGVLNVNDILDMEVIF